MWHVPASASPMQDALSLSEKKCSSLPLLLLLLALCALGEYEWNGEREEMQAACQDVASCLDSSCYSIYLQFLIPLKVLLAGAGEGCLRWLEPPPCPQQWRSWGMRYLWEDFLLLSGWLVLEGGEQQAASSVPLAGQQEPQQLRATAFPPQKAFKKDPVEGSLRKCENLQGEAWIWCFLFCDLTKSNGGNLKNWLISGRKKVMKERYPWPQWAWEGGRHMEADFEDDKNVFTTEITECVKKESKEN